MVAALDEIYPTQGIYIKFGENPVLPDSMKPGVSPMLGRKMIGPAIVGAGDESGKLDGLSPSPLFSRSMSRRGDKFHFIIASALHIIANLLVLFVCRTTRA